MINKEQFNVLEYVKKEEYIASMQGMRYMLKKNGDFIDVVIWPEPKSLAKTDDSLKISAQFPLSQDGIEEARIYLNEQYEAQKSLWDMVRIRK